MKKELEKQFIGKGEVKGFNFNLLMRNEIASIYHVQNENDNHYEVFKRRFSPVCIDFEKRLYSETDFKEFYPRSKDFGINAWTFTDLEKTMKKFVEITKTSKSSNAEN